MRDPINKWEKSTKSFYKNKRFNSEQKRKVGRASRDEWRKTHHKDINTKNKQKNQLSKYDNENLKAFLGNSLEMRSAYKKGFKQKMGAEEKGIEKQNIRLAQKELQKRKLNKGGRAKYFRK